MLEEATAARAWVGKVVVASSMSIYGEGAYRCPAEDSRDRVADATAELARRGLSR